MSRIYDNKPLSNLPVVNLTVSNEWNEKEYTRGDGAIIEGNIKARSRVAITDKTGQKYRYFILYVEPQKIHKRKFNSNGDEIEPNFSETQKVRTGYLNSSYKVEAKGTTDKLTASEATDLLTSPYLSNLVQGQQPAGCEKCLSLWLQEIKADKTELENGDSVRVKTSGNSPLIHNFAKMEGQSVSVSNYAGGEQVGGSWTDKIMTMKSGEPNSPENNDDDDEWN